MKVKFTSLLLVAVMVILMCTPVSAYTSSSPTYYKPWMAYTQNVSSYVNIRASASTSSSSVGKLYANNFIQVVGTDSTGSWYRVQYDTTGSNFGYIYGSYLQIPDTYKYYAAVTATSGANFRAGNSISSSIICRIPYSRSVPYCNVTANEGYHWIGGVWGTEYGCLREDVIAT